MIDLRVATFDDVAILSAISPNDLQDYYERCLNEGRTILIASVEGVDCGCAQLNEHPRYSLYKKLKYPEIQDVAVVPEYRGRGIATTLITHIENIVREKGCDGIGISVGITREFGAAQRLYCKLGYVPDGYGVTYDREGVDSDRLYPANELVFMLVKEFIQA